MPLPLNDTVWPPLGVRSMYTKMAEWAAWYSGEPSRIIDVYSAIPNLNNGGQTPWWRFWSRARAGATENAQRAQIHVPIASDLAALSGSLLFGEPPRIRIRRDEDEEEDDTCPQCGMPMASDAEPHPDVPHTMDMALAGAMPPGPPARPKPAPDSPAEKTEARLLEIVEKGDVYARLVEAAETAAALGGVFIYPVWDTDFKDFPIMAVAQADNAIPEFNYGFLTAVTFWRDLTVDGVRWFRHVERHEVQGRGDARKAVVLNGLFVGTQWSLGTQEPLSARPETANLMPVVELPFKELDVEYVPNIRPNRLWRSLGVGVPDIQGSETLLDALDETYASWMRDIRLAKARIIVPRDYLRPDVNNGNAPSFDIDQEIYVPMEMEPGLSQDSRALMAHQFQIRYLEHAETAKDLVARIVSNAGYVPGSLGLDAPQKTGAGLRVSEHKTLLTLRKKSGWWRTAIANCLYHMLQIDAEIFKSGIEPMRPTVITSDSIIDNPLELAQTAMALKTAESASIETRVRLVHPDWSEPEVDAEVDRIQEELASAAGPATVQSRGAFGDPSQDPAATGNKPMTPGATGRIPTNTPPMQIKPAPDQPSEFGG